MWSGGGAVVADGVDLADGVLGTADGDGDGAAEAGGVAVRTIPATPLEMMKDRWPGPA